ncbi:hypothetical protein ACFT8P_28360 [Streptomyces sp. NPDC057101]|uniref:hypothetical protein n=1 Tax=Streptomyces sp. NPDC057101 TaxID=3346020 RepID=UPI00362B3243
MTNQASFGNHPTAGPGQGSSLDRVVPRAKLIGFSQTIEFQYNPTEINLSHNAEGYADPVSKGDNESRNILAHLATRGSTRLILSSLTFTGDRCQPTVDTLIKWVTPLGQTPRREQLEFVWGAVGAGFHYKVELMRFDCTFSRFTRTGRPIRAEIRNLTLHILEQHRSEPRQGPRRRPEMGGHRSSDPNTDPLRSVPGIGG